ncbi:hypothetical protein [Mucilaginibacter sp. CSA2-8R]|uniref:hypothetical protein n=1 Tax=Mucilaginibacter sp. CSA2-8R TaxID=3141542 RepID=UPI00315CB75D
MKSKYQVSSHSGSAYEEVFKKQALEEIVDDLSNGKGSLEKNWQKIGRNQFERTVTANKFSGSLNDGQKSNMHSLIVELIHRQLALQLSKKEYLCGYYRVIEKLQ